MIRNYLKTGWRNIRKNVFHSSINVLGLSIGIAFSLLIGAYVWNELRINKDLKNASRQYIIQSKWKDPAMGMELTSIGPLAKALKEEYPHLVENYYRWDGVTSNISKGNKVFREGIQIGDSTMISMFGFPLLHGDPETAMDQPNSVVITANRAIKYFGKTDVVGETLTVESFSGNKKDFMITGVLKDLPENSVNFVNSDNNNQIFIPESSIDFFSRNIDGWFNQYIVSYVQLARGVQPSQLEAPMKQLLKRNASLQFAENLKPVIVPLKSYYLTKDNGLVKKMLYTVSFIALFILIMAIINFVNVSISKSTTRIKEIGIRKVMGGLKKQLIVQFMVEAILLASFATALALIMYIIAKPFLSEVLGKQIPEFSEFPLSFISLPLVISVIVGSVAGIYPALVLSTLKAVDSIKGKLKSVKENILLRKSLVGFQFFTASMVLIGAIIVTKQVSMFFNKDLGYNKEYIVSASVPRNWTDEGIRRMKTIRDQFEQLPGISSVSLSWQIQNGWTSGSNPVYAEGKDSLQQSITVETMISDEKYLETYQIPLSGGRYFQQPSDSMNLVINETAAKALGWQQPMDAIGKKVFFNRNFSMNVIGVTKDFHFGSMKVRIPPIIMLPVERAKIFRLLSFKLKPGNIGASIAALEKKWSQLLPGSAFEYRFMDDDLKRLYQSELQLKKASEIATVLALVIVLLGVIGLISLSIQKRTKEIGIRKVLGASPSNIIYLFLKEFLPVILIGGIISIPAAYYIMNNWLSDYAYRIDITAQPFMMSIFGLGVITTILISLQIAKASAENPVKNLRTE